MRSQCSFQILNALLHSAYNLEIFDPACKNWGRSMGGRGVWFRTKVDHRRSRWISDNLGLLRFEATQPTLRQMRLVSKIEAKFQTC